MTVPFRPADDFPGVVDQTQPVTLLRPGSSSATPIAAALLSAPREREAEPSQGRYTETDVVWHLPAAQLTDPPKPGDVLLDAAGRRWTILAVTRATAGARWRCECRDLAIALGLDQHVDIERAVYVKGQHGAAVATWRTWRTGVPARLQPIAAEAQPAAGAEPAAIRYTVHLDHDGLLDHTYRLRVPDGTLLRVVACRKADRLDALLEVEAVPFHAAEDLEP